MSAPASKPRVQAVKDVIAKKIVGYIILLCSVIVFLFYCVYLISSRSLGPKHTHIREMIFPLKSFGSSVMRQTTETFHCWGEFGVPHATLLSCLLSCQHWDSMVTLGFLSLLPPKNSTDRSCTAQHITVQAILRSVC